jgi:hypothetical protein
MEIEETCELLKPLIGKKADRLYRAWLAEDRPGKAEVETALRILKERHFGHGQALEHPILIPPEPAQAKGEYPLARVVYNGSALHEFGLREGDWIQHISIFGRTGAGKTNVAMILVGNLLHQGRPFLIFDWKRNYRDLLATKQAEKLNIYTVGKRAAPFYFNPLIPPPGTPPRTWLKKLIEVIAGALYVGEGVKYILMKAIDDVYQKHGLYEEVVIEHYPTMQDLFSYLEKYKATGREANWMISTLRAVRSLCFGGIGDTVNTTQGFKGEEILSNNVILELDALSETDKVFLIDTLLLWIYHYRMGQGSREHFKHAIFIEEAHHMLKKEAGAGAEKVIDILLREIRELGESIILIDQMPSLIAPTALANTHTSIFMNLKTRPDVAAAASCLLLDADNKTRLGELPTGQAVIKQQDRYAKPFRATFPHIPIPKGKVTDSDVAAHMADRGGFTSTASIPVTPAEASLTQPVPGADERMKEFLMDVLEHPMCGVVARYKRLGISRRKGTELKKRMIDDELLCSEDVSTEVGTTTLLELTAKGRQILAAGPAQRAHGKESLEHRYWKARAAAHFSKQGYEVTTEEESPEPNGPDLVLRKGDDRIACEVETGKSDIEKNVLRCAEQGYEEMVICCTNDGAFSKVKRVTQHLKDMTIAVRILKTTEL